MASRLKRRSSFGIANRSIVLESSVNVEDHSITETDEEQERRARRELLRRQSIGGRFGQHVTPIGTPVVPVGGHTAASTPAAPGAQSAPGAAGTPSGGSVSGYSAAQLAEHYSSCMKLSAENKITVKNAFQLRLIDYMTEMLKKKQSDMDNFQAASCALDASTKIYAYRVDSVHNETMKLASGVGSGTGKVTNEGESEDTFQDLNQDEDGNQTKKRTKKRRRAATVEKNINNINCAKFDLEYTIDPLFKKVSAQFDSGGSGGQFLSTLRMQDDSCGMILDSNALIDPMEDKEADPANESALDIDDLAPIVEETSLICPELAKFSFRDWNLEDDLRSSQEKDSEDDEISNGKAFSKLHNEDHAFDAAAAEDLNDIENNDGGGFFDEDFVDADEGAEYQNNQEKQSIGGPETVVDRKKLWEHLSLVPNEYSYFDSGRLGAWAGPKHWKFKPMSKSTALGTIKTTDSEEKKRKKQKEREKLSFFEQDDENGLLAEIVEKAMVMPRKPIKLQKKTIDKWDSETNMLPEDLRYSGKDFVKLISMPERNVVPKKENESQVVDDSVQDYDFDNLNDTQNFCPEDAGANSYPADDETGRFTNVFSQTVNIEGDDSNGLGLVAAPNRVEKIQIGFTRHAKKIDMRKLKSVEWGLLQESIILDVKQEEKENVSSVSNETVEGDRSTRKKDVETNLSQIYKTLKSQPTQHLPPKMVENISVPLAFVALLHLCNERTLQLGSLEDLTDILIRK